MTLRSTLRTVAATILVAASVALLPQSPASAAACSGSTGISVVVDSNELGAGISAGCDADGGGPAASNFGDAGYKLQESQAAGMTGFICKVDGRPSDGDCTETDAYWSLWWSDGKSGKWVYANRGAYSLTVPGGGYVAFSWHKGSGQATPPDVAPTPRVAPAQPSPTPGATKSTKPKPSTKPTPKPTAKPSAAPTSATPTTSPASSSTPTPSEQPSEQPSETPSEMPSETSAVPTPTTTTDVPSIDEITDGPEATAASTDGTDDGGGFPAWLGIGLVVVVLGAAGAVPVLRRRGR